MSGVSKEWLLIALFFVAFFAYTFAEAAWLKIRGKTTYGRAFVGALLTNILAITVGYGFSAILLMVLLVLAFGGALEAIGNAGLWVLVGVGVLVPLILLIIAKRFMVKILKMSEEASPWTYALAASVGFFIATLGSIALFAYFN